VGAGSRGQSVAILGSSKQHIHTICGSIEERHLALREFEVSEQVAAPLKTLHSHDGSVFMYSLKRRGEAISEQRLR
jgi:hypothetical protein